MSSSKGRSSKIELSILASHPELLRGLDAWLQLGLLSEIEVKQLCRQYLVCQIEAPAVSQPQIAEIVPAEIPAQKEPVLATPAALPNTENSDFETPEIEPNPNFIAQMLHSLIAEISVVWLLFLGVFMVVVSSGVLAASQWEKFPAAGQYGVLLAYTLTFWAIGSWANKQPNLQLTAQTLQAVTLLLVPINFWAMDTFGLWRYPGDWIVAIAAAAILSWITLRIIKYRYEQLSGSKIARSIALNHLGLSYLHWGWAFANFSLAAVYLGTVGTAAATVYQVRQQYLQSRRSAIHPPSSPTFFGSKQDLVNYKKAILIAYSLGILLSRAIFVKDINIAEMGLALAISGTLLGWVDWQQFGESSPDAGNKSEQHNSGSLVNWQVVGGSLLGLGWLVCVEDIPLQAIAVSGLGAWFFANRLWRFWQKFDWLMLFAIGLQSFWLTWRVIPVAMQTQIVRFLTQITDSGSTPWALWGVVLLPYLILTVSATQLFYRRQKFQLASFGETLAFCLGTVLTIISLVNPCLRSINLFTSAFLLGWVTRKYAIKRNDNRPKSHVTRVDRAQNPASLVYLTHILGLCAICSAIDLFFPRQTAQIWSVILLGLMVAEWSVFVKLQARNLRNNSLSLRWHPSCWQSAWYLGLVLAGLSYFLLYGNVRLPWNLVWLTVPLALTAVGKYSARNHKQLACTLSSIALILAQFLTSNFSLYQLGSLGLAALLMSVNTYYLVEPPAAAITVGFSLSFATVALLKLGFLSGWDWAIAWTIALVCLWVLRDIASRYSTGESKSAQLAKIYDRAFDGWAVLLAVLLLANITVYSFNLRAVTGLNLQPSVQVLAAILGIIAAVVYRSYQQFAPQAIYAVAWCLELLLIVGLSFLPRTPINLVVANIALGLSLQLLGDFWRMRQPDRPLLPSFHIIPLLYGCLGLMWRSQTFASWTGLTSLGIALIAIGIGRRQPEFKPLVYLGLIGVSVSAFESLLYQLLQTRGGAFGDGLIVMATLGTTLTYIYRILSPWLSNYLGITNAELKIFAHLHWLGSSWLLISASANVIKSGLNLGLVTGTLLVQYALLQGRNNPDRQWANIWIYLGFLEAFAIRLYWINTPLVKYISGPLGPWKVAIGSLFAYFLYILPWENLGWSKTPWKIVAGVIPIVLIVESPAKFYPVSWLVAVAFYIFLAWEQRQLRFTYISVAIIDWILLRWFSDLRLSQPEWYFTTLGLSFLYIMQFDPMLKLPEQKPLRHNLRMLATGLICGIPLLTQEYNGLVAGAFSLVTIAAGLALRVRAFLFVGTGVFVLNVFYQLVVLIFDYPLIKWAIGLAFGVVFIWIAATFETRRDRIAAFVQHWVVQLQSWD
ncbi:MAG: hypothetical protein ACRC62_02115 [Microcoleus sp.]